VHINRVDEAVHTGGGRVHALARPDCAPRLTPSQLLDGSPREKAIRVALTETAFSWIWWAQPQTS